MSIILTVTRSLRGFQHLGLDRTFSRSFANRLSYTKPPRKGFIEKLISKDKVAEGFELVYRAPSASYIFALSAVSASTISLFLAQGVVSLLSRDSLTGFFVDKRTWGEKVQLRTNENEMVGFAVSFVLFNIVIFLTIRRYPLRIYKNADKYVAIFEGHIPLRRQQLNFVKGQVEPIPPKGVLPWKENRFMVNGRRCIIFDHHFKTPAEFNMMINEKYKYY